MIKILATLAAVSVAAPAAAQSFSVSLGGKTLGVLQFTQSGNTTTLHSTLNSTPMGVFNGSFSGTSTGTAKDGRFLGESRSSRKERDVIVEFSEGRATSTRITPASERTEMSDIGAVPANVRDPVRIFAALARAGGCPKAMQMYDGRRVVALSPTGSGKDGDTLTCTISYRITAGPKHLSPLGISSAKISLFYDVSSGQQSLQKMQIASGLFRVSLNRTD